MYSVRFELCRALTHGDLRGIYYSKKIYTNRTERLDLE